MKVQHLLYESDEPGKGRLTATAGRVKIVYYEHEQDLHIVNSSTGEKLITMPYTFTLAAFINSVDEYDKVCNHK